ncbi:hypothetical protein ACQP2P_15220 [Dactylosporangium sp. CA-139114]|uniref:hypothetical protein n=1 Tax=Dactylosporangium sp. CA-139114 TaxID=3239931 RepID=UPI003D958156
MPETSRGQHDAIRAAVSGANSGDAFTSGPRQRTAKRGPGLTGPRNYTWSDTTRLGNGAARQTARANVGINRDCRSTVPPRLPPWHTFANVDTRDTLPDIMERINRPTIINVGRHPPSVDGAAPTGACMFTVRARTDAGVAS